MSARAAVIRATPGPPDCTRPVIPCINAYADPVPSAIGLTAIVTVGDEILSGHTQDTNSSFLARLAFAAGRPVAHIEVVADQPAAIIAAIRRAVDDPEISRIAVCGGIGPTPDDRTFPGRWRRARAPLELNPSPSPTSRRWLSGCTPPAGSSSPWSPRRTGAARSSRRRDRPHNRRGMAPPLAIDLGDDR